MSKNKKHESKKERKKRIIRNDKKRALKYYQTRKQKSIDKMPRSIDEAVAMGILR